MENEYIEHNKDNLNIKLFWAEKAGYITINHIEYIDGDVSVDYTADTMETFSDEEVMGFLSKFLSDAFENIDISDVTDIDEK